MADRGVPNSGQNRRILAVKCQPTPSTAAARIYSTPVTRKVSKSGLERARELCDLLFGLPANHQIAAPIVGPRRERERLARLRLCGCVRALVGDDAEKDRRAGLVDIGELRERVAFIGQDEGDFEIEAR